MHTYNNLKARMKSQPPSTWSPVLKPRDGTQTPPIVQFGTGLIEATPTEIKDPPPVNQIMYQAFEWYTPSWETPITAPATTTVNNIVDSTAATLTTTQPVPQPFVLPAHYSVITSLLPSLGSLGITSMWLPPGCKASNKNSNGYDVYDLYDLGEFDSKGGRATKWGSKEELIKLGKAAEDVGIGLLWDAVLNHRAYGDNKEKAQAVTVLPEDRRIETSPIKDVETWSRFDYSARNGKYSSMTYNWRHFTAVDWDALTRTKAILKFTSDGQTSKPGWSNDVDDELGNYDYLMFADIDYSQPDVQVDVLNWATWLPTQIPGLKGLRLDAIKHYSARFQYTLLKHLRDNAETRDWFVVGEYWRGSGAFLARHVDSFAGHMHLFDVQLLYNLHAFSTEQQRDLRKILDGSLVELKPHHAVTFVTNHDTQATQELAAPVAPWFTAHAYALILLRSAGHPCIFHGDVFGTLGPQPTPPSCGNRLMRLALARKLYAYGPQHDFFRSRDCIGWSREGHAADGGGAGLAVVLNSSWGWKALKVFVGRAHRGEVWTDLMGWSWDEVRVDERGWGEFRVGPRLMGVWTAKTAKGREVIDQLVWPPLKEEEYDVA